MTSAFVGIGSNLGDRRRNGLKSLAMMDQIPDCRVLGRSEWYLTRPVGVEGQEWYVNGVAHLSTGLAARDLLHHLLSIEEKLGRTRPAHWAARTIDLDILLFGDEVVDTPDLKIPHPLMAHRRFVLVPLAQLVPGLRHPVLDLTVAELLQRLPEDGQEVVLIEE